jgi:hypothetical protein
MYAIDAGACKSVETSLRRRTPSPRRPIANACSTRSQIARIFRTSNAATACAFSFRLSSRSSVRSFTFSMFAALRSRRLGGCRSPLAARRAALANALASQERSELGPGTVAASGSTAAGGLHRDVDLAERDDDSRKAAGA